MTVIVSPPAMIMPSEAWFRMLMKLPKVGKACGARAEKAAIIRTRPSSVPYLAR